jgi:hypothetical protein
MAGEANDLLLRLEAFSCYLLLLHLEFLGFAAQELEKCQIRDKT